MAYAILRTAKLKSASSIRGAGGHNARTRETPNADPNRQNIVIVDPGDDPYKAVKNRISAAGIKPRKNQVLAQEILLTASPEFFRPQDPSKSGEWSDNRLKAWRRAAEKWLFNTFGDNIVSAHLHLDESTPHIQAIVVPITKDGRLSARDLFNRKTLREYQDSYAEALSHLKIKRGIKGSKAKHEKVKKFYQLAESPTPYPPRVPTPPAMVREAPRQEWAEEQSRQIQQLTEQLHAQAQALELARRREREIRKTMEQQESEMRKLREERKRLADEMRALPLIQVLDALGLTHNRKKDKNQWIGDGHRINVNGMKWYDHIRQQGGGGAIDLVMHVLGVDFKAAVGWLADRFSGAAAAATMRAEASETVKTAPKPEFRLPERDESAWPTVRRWLIDERGIPAAAADRLHEMGFVYATRRGRYVNAVFPGQSKRPPQTPQIAELKGTGGDFAGLAAGSNKDRDWFQIRTGTTGTGRGNLRRLVLVESALDAISYALLHRDGPPALIISTAGVRPDHPAIKQALYHGWEIICGYDRDEAGEMAYQAMNDRWDGRIARQKPKYGKDWNDVLQRQARQDARQDARQEYHQGPRL